MTEKRRTTEQTIQIIEKLRRYFQGSEKRWDINYSDEIDRCERILALLRDPDLVDKERATAIRHIVESYHDGLGGSGWYEVRMMIWLWDGADRGERP